MITGAQIRAARGLLGWTVRNLARRAIVSIATVNMIEGAVPHDLALDFAFREVWR